MILSKLNRTNLTPADPSITIPSEIHINADQTLAVYETETASYANLGDLLDAHTLYGDDLIAECAESSEDQAFLQSALA